MYFFYIDEAGTRDPKPKDGRHIYVLTAVGIPENKWKAFDREISNLKMELADYLRRDSKGDFDLADCEVKSSWLRNPDNSKGKSPFLRLLYAEDITKISNLFFSQVSQHDLVIISSIIDKRELSDEMSGSQMHNIAYQFLLERIQHYMRDNKSGQNATIVMDDMSKQLNRDVTLKHAEYQRRGNRNMGFPSIIEYPFFVRSELSNGVQLADLLAYTVYHAFLYDKPDYPWLQRILKYFSKQKKTRSIGGLKVWPNGSKLMNIKRKIERKQKPDK